jgi:hypothetical protein
VIFVDPPTVTIRKNEYMGLEGHEITLECDVASFSAKHWYVPASDDSKSIIVSDGEDGEVREYFGKVVSTSDITPLTIFLQ